MKREKKVKYREQSVSKLEEFTPIESQKELIEEVANNSLTFVEGPAGTGKSSSILYHFCHKYLLNNYMNIVIVRTPVEAGDDRIGFLPSSKEEKLEPHFASSRKILEDFLGTEKVKCDTGKRIHFTIPNFILGATLDNSLIFIDEAQQLSPMIMKLLLERIGNNSVCVVAGDSSQLYATDKKRNGLKDAIGRFIDEEGIAKYPDIGYHKLEAEDVLRSDIVKTVIEAYN